jgi:hypothetical protein
MLLVGTAAVAASVAALGYVASVLKTTSGLSARYAYVGDQRSAALDQIDAAFVSPALLRQIHRTLSPVRDRWDGYLVVPATDSYRFLVNSDGPAQLTVAGALVADQHMTTGGPLTVLNRGLHSIRLDYTPSAPVPRLLVLQSRGAMGAFSPVPALYLVPRIVGGREVRLRRFAVPAGRFAPAVVLAWAVIALLVLLRYRRRRAPEPGRTDYAIVLVLVGAAILLAVGSWWGLPAYFSWAPDEVVPDEVLTAFDARFSHGWATKYPPAHYALLSAVSLPWFLAAHLGLLDLADLEVVSSLLLVGRLTSIVMMLAIVWLTYSMTLEHHGRRPAVFAALVIVSAMPFTYYGKVANLDVPYVFWLTCAFRYLARTGTTATPADFYGLALTGAAAIATKDQAYGFFVLPAVAIVVLAVRRPRHPGVPSLRVVAITAGLTAVALAVLMNVPFNARGVLLHMQLITGPNSENFRMYARTLPGSWKMLADGVWLMAGIMSWPLLLAAVAGAVLASVRRHVPSTMLLLAGVSYVVTFLWLVLYQYDRFWLGVVVVVAPTAGWWIDTVTRRGSPARLLRLTLTVAVFAYAIARCAALDVLMLQDSRYAAERRLRAEAGPGEGVTAIGERPNLPRPEIVPWTGIRARTAEFEQQSRALLIENVGYGLRRGEGYDDALVRTRLPGDPRYTALGDFRSPVPFPLSLERRFSAVEEEESSNLTKINPLIRLYRRTMK